VNPVFIEDVENLGSELQAVLQDGDLVLTMGAGSIGRIVSQLKNVLESAA
jgi:UDP-N-acetylmuramate--alanine ligase